MTARNFLTPLTVALVVLAGCTSVPADTGSPTPPAASMAPSPPSPDPRIGLRAGLYDAEQALWNMRLLSTTQPSDSFVRSTNSDLAFTGKYAIQGNYNGFQVWDISNPAQPTLRKSFFCPASQSDVSVYKNLL